MRRVGVMRRCCASKGSAGSRAPGRLLRVSRFGATTAAAAGGIGSEIGARWTGKNRKGAEAAGIEIGNPGAVAVTPSNLVTMKVKVSAMGAIKEVTDILSVVPLAEVFERAKAGA